MTPHQKRVTSMVTTVWVERWRKLKAWPTALDNWNVDVRVRHLSDHSTGNCSNVFERRIVVTASEDIVDSLGTVLHEFAHAATPIRRDAADNAHGLVWQKIFSAAVLEVTGREVPPGFENYRLMDRAVHTVMAKWWEASGNKLAFSLLWKGKR